MIDASGRKTREPEVWRLSRRSVFVPFAHGAMMYRRDVFDRVGGYREQCQCDSIASKNRQYCG
jgi:hypothetical protein